MTTQMQTHCPQCRQLTDWTDNPHRPFCSERCRLVDLGAWLSEGYRVPDSGTAADGPDSEQSGG